MTEFNKEYMEAFLQGVNPEPLDDTLFVCENCSSSTVGKVTVSELETKLKNAEQEIQRLKTSLKNEVARNKQLEEKLADQGIHLSSGTSALTSTASSNHLVSGKSKSHSKKRKTSWPPIEKKAHSDERQRASNSPESTHMVHQLAPSSIIEDKPLEQSIKATTLKENDVISKKGRRTKRPAKFQDALVDWGSNDQNTYRKELSKIISESKKGSRGRGSGAFLHERYVLANNPFPGWKREHVFRATGDDDGAGHRASDIYFHPPCDGKKLRSRPDIIRFFSDRSVDITPLLECFNFNKKWCVCQDPTRTDAMVACSQGVGGCNGRVHPGCVGLGPLSVEQCAGIGEYTCQLCERYECEVVATLPPEVEAAARVSLEPPAPAGVAAATGGAGRPPVEGCRRKAPASAAAALSVWGQAGVFAASPSPERTQAQGMQSEKQDLCSSNKNDSGSSSLAASPTADDTSGGNCGGGQKEEEEENWKRVW
eukprot:CAMPEP_0194587532 /NCGR_PEP_ID=MMETSP0292-20121207/19214_1 /TAXON_ID=39354 /ORGANISM="Heterosigma akashiwo, Strain CCMP2393" /LENGTH=481 /DNA_ID=CAMNT_0039443809 /DNA_START=36 /DNA_END=1478 /DNA_ORIENTATION=+